MPIYKANVKLIYIILIYNEDVREAHFKMRFSSMRNWGR